MIATLNVKTDERSIYNDWHFMPESQRGEFISMNANSLGNIMLLIKISHLDALGYVYDMWNHGLDEKATELLLTIVKKMDKANIDKAHKTLLHTMKRSETESKMASFCTFYRQVVGE